MRTDNLQHMKMTGLFLLLLIPGCLEVKVTTTVHSDGSCERVVTTNPREQKVPDKAFPIPVDSTWTPTWEKAEGNDGFRYTATKHFADGNELAREYSQDSTDPRILRITPEVEKRFRWFYTYLTYRETYHRYSSFRRIPPSQVLSEDEIRRISEGEKNDTLKKKLDEWVFRNLYEGFHEALLDGAKRLGDPTLTVKAVAGRKEELFRTILGDTLHADEFDSTLTMMSRFFNSPGVIKLRAELKRAWDAAEEMLQTEQRADAEYTNTVVMPGLVVDTNAGEVRGTTVSWKFSADRFRLRDHEMWVESRVMNVWTVVLTGIVALLLVGALAVVGRARPRAVRS
jgi:hypothetical protein